MNVRKKLKNIKLLYKFVRFIKEYPTRLKLGKTFKKWHYLASKISSKQNIRVAFMMYEVPFWKNEALFFALKRHPRFTPAIWIVDNPHVKNLDLSVVNKERCLQYVEERGFTYYLDLSLKELRENFAPDYIFVVHPYDNHIPFEVDDLKNELPCCIPYAYWTLTGARLYNNLKIQLFHRFYLESDYIQQEAKLYMLNKARNTKVTGLPMADLLISESRKASNGALRRMRKNIIWAPHWSIGHQTGDMLDASTFLGIADNMVCLANKYSETINLIFKPHPLLKRSLYNSPEWGKTRADEYYRTWANGVNMRLEEGEYTELFIESDALIHDCSSFILEYLLMNKPCLYLVRPDARCCFNKSAMEALQCYQKAYTIEDVESFIKDVLSGKDCMSTRRQQFVNSYLLPDGFSPVQKIVEDLLNPLS